MDEIIKQHTRRAMEEFALEINRTLSPKSQFNPNTPLRYLKKKKKRGYVDHFNADSAAHISESFEPSSGRDYQHVSVIHLKPRPIRALRYHIKARKIGRKKKALLKSLFILLQTYATQYFSDLILHHISQAIWGSSERVLGIIKKKKKV